MNRHLSRARQHRGASHGRAVAAVAVVVTATLVASFTTEVSLAAAAQFHPAKPNLGAAVPVTRTAAGSVAAKPVAVMPTAPVSHLWVAGRHQVGLPVAGQTRSLASPPLGYVPGWANVIPGLAIKEGRAAAGSTASPVSKITVTLLSAAQARAAGHPGVAIELARADTATATSPVTLRLSDQLLASAFGADYRSRARWLQQPAGGRPGSGTAVSTTHQAGATTMTALVSNHPVLLMTTASPTSAAGTGSFGVTPLKQSDSWQVSAQTGDFSWTYPMRVPPAPAGGAPQLALQYDSQSVDGETGSTNNQPSGVGDGWSLAASGSIDRAYTPCANSDGPGAAIPGSGDLCWSGANATVSFAGHSGALVRDAGGGWKLQGDDSTRVEQLTGTSNGTYDGDYWRLTTTDGTQYYFGLNRLPGWVAGDAVTNAAWTVPVCGTAVTNCSGTATTAGPFNNQAWRWNLDYVVDPHGNAQSYSYTQESNSYAENGSGAISYTRGGELSEVDYGLRSNNLFASTAASGKVLFHYDARCDTSQGEPLADCDPATRVAAYWPDVPWDQDCSTGSCTQTSPSFWSSTMLGSITTEVLSGASYSNVDQWTLGHSWPDPGDSTAAALWLTQVSHTGYSGAASISTPTTTFVGVKMQNRVWVVDGLAPLVKWRISSINTGSGDVISVAYTAQQCTDAMVPALKASPQTNTNRCFPSWWTPQTTPPQPGQLDFFHKYLVTQVDDDPVTGGPLFAQRHETDYLYTGTPAWRFDQSPGTADGQRTWSVWAGYDTVEVRSGDPSHPATQHTTDYTFLQGLDGDPNGDIHTPTSSTRDVVVTASNGTRVRDSLWWAGRVLEQVARNGSSGGSGVSTTPTLSDTVTVPWASAPTATVSRTYTYTDPADGSTYQATLTTAAYLTGASTVTSSSPTSTGSRSETVTSSFDSYGRVVSVDDAASDADTTCTRTAYATNTADWLISYPSTVSSVGVGCSATPSYPGDAVRATATSYDGQALGAAPTAGNVTTKQVASAYAGDGTPTWQTVQTSTYDGLGRVTLSSDPRTTPVSSTATAYTPATGGPLTQTVVTTNPQAWTVTTGYLPAWGVPASVKDDANNNLTEASYDALGRRTGVWLPNRPRSTNPNSPSSSYAYTLATSGPNIVTTTSINAAGGTSTSYTFYDGLWQQRQTQTAAEGGGTVVVDTTTDASGQTTLQTAPYYATGAPSTALINQTVTVPSQTQTTYDGAGRVTASTLLNGNSAMWSTNYTYLGTDRVDQNPPAGGTPSSTYTNLRGHTVKLVQYLANSVDSNATTETTSYQYDPRGDLTRMTDNSANTWQWGYDVLGEQTSAIDPDSGTTSKLYYPDGDLKTSTDQLGNKLTFTYDSLRRKTAEYSGVDTSGTQLAAWTYDTATAGFGALASATRYVGGIAGQPGTGTAYKSSVAGYNSLGAPTSTTTLIGGSTPVAGSYTTSYTYAADGSLASQTDPIEGGLPQEKITTGFDSLGHVSGASSALGSIVTSITYTHLGQLGQTTQSQGAQVFRTYTYDTTTLRLNELLTQRTASTNAVVSDDRYSYNQAGDVTADSNVTPATGTDTQCYTYDHLRNLTAAWTPTSNSCTTAPSTGMSFGGPAPYWTSYSVDPATGNRSASTKYTISAGTVSASTTSTYHYNVGPGPVQPHAVQSVINTTGTSSITDSYSYNADGSATALPGQSISYDVEGHPSSTTITATSKTQNDVYDAAGNLLLQTDPVTGTTAYLGDTQLHVASGSATVSASRTYTVLGQAVAERDTTAGITGNKYYFLDDDPNNTATAQVAAATAAVTRRYLDPFGNSRGTATAWISNHQFLGAAQNPLTTSSSTTAPLSLLGAREYDPVIGKFLALDPVLDPGNPQQDNGYSYGWNNPLNHADPSGLRPADDSGAIRGNDLKSWEHTENQAQAYAPQIAAASQSIDAQQAAVNQAQKQYDKAAAYSRKGLALYIAFMGALMEAAGCGGIASEHEGGGGCGGIGISADQLIDRESRHAEQRASQYFSYALDASAESQSLDQAIAKLDEAKADLERAICGAGGQSFTAGTQVLMADGTYKPIDQIKTGDAVRSTDPATGKTTVEPVTRLWLNHDNDLLDLSVTSGGKTSIIHTTQHHPFWDDTHHTWIEADRLVHGERLHTTNGTVTVEATRTVPGAAWMWDLTIATTHTFYIHTSTATVLVHNSGCGDTVEAAPGEAKVAFGPAPESAWTTFERVESKGSPLPGYKGGSVYDNSTGLLPGGNGVTYREWDINPNVSGVDRGGERIVTGSDGTGYYTNDHYRTFTQFTGQGG